MQTYESLGTFKVTRKQHEQFKEGSLWQSWAEQYPMLFDENDVENVAKNASRGYYFHEWLAAIIVFHTTGYYSLVDHYQYAPHARKNKIFRSLVGDKVAELARSTSTYCPDLLVYKPDFSHWYFVEVKGPTDKLRENQVTFFNELQDLTQKQIFTVQFREYKINK